jgi:hypothetical protein
MGLRQFFNFFVDVNQGSYQFFFIKLREAAVGIQGTVQTFKISVIIDDIAVILSFTFFIITKSLR